MTITLTPELQEFVNRKVESGGYPSADAVVWDALGLMREQEDINQAQLEELRREIDLGIADLEAGEVSTKTALEILAEVRARRGAGVPQES